MSRAHGTLRMFDANEDGRVSVDEYLTFFNFLAQVGGGGDRNVASSRWGRGGGGGRGGGRRGGTPVCRWTNTALLLISCHMWGAGG